MLSTTLFTVAAVLGMSSAAPLKARYDQAVEIIFNGAAGASYTVEVPLDGSVTATNNVLSISSIEAPIDVDSLCILVTIDSPPPVLVEGPSGTWVVGPPQTITSISCSSGSTPPPPPPPSSITIEFDGADPSLGAKYTLSVPLDGTLTYTNNVLSISTLVSDHADLASSCNFTTVDGTNALSQLNVDTWALGPPQTVTAVSCTA